MHVITQLASLLDIKGVKEASELEKTDPLWGRP